MAMKGERKESEREKERERMAAHQGWHGGRDRATGGRGNNYTECATAVEPFQPLSHRR